MWDNWKEQEDQQEQITTFYSHFQPRDGSHSMSSNILTSYGTRLPEHKPQNPSPCPHHERKESIPSPYSQKHLSYQIDGQRKYHHPWEHLALLDLLQELCNLCNYFMGKKKALATNLSQCLVSPETTCQGSLTRQAQIQEKSGNMMCL